MEDKSKKTVRKWALTFVSGAFAVALALLFVLVLRSIAVQITPPPGPVTEPYPDTSTPELCEQAGGRWVDEVTTKTVRQPPAQPVPVEEERELRSFCQGPLQFERERNLQSEASQQTSLFVFAIGGAIAVVASLLIVVLSPVAPGLMIGGIVSFFIAGIHIWVLAPGIGRLITIVVIFLILVGVGLYTFREKK